VFNSSHYKIHNFLTREEKITTIYSLSVWIDTQMMPILWRITSRRDKRLWMQRRATFDWLNQVAPLLPEQLPERAALETNSSAAGQGWSPLPLLIILIFCCENNNMNNILRHPPHLLLCNKYHAVIACARNTFQARIF